MNRFVPITAAAMLALAGPAVAQQGGVVSPSQLSTEQVKNVQQALNREGFSSGHVDGRWGPITETAVREFQRRKNLQTTGQLDGATLAALGVSVGGSGGAGGQAVGGPAAPTAQGAAGTAAPAAAVMGTANAAAGAGAANPGAANPGAANPGAANPGVPAGNGNQAVATTGASSAQPATGANSFSRAEAQVRIGRHGYQNVSGLGLDRNGIWRGTATKDGQTVQVWLDFKGDVGQQ